MTSDDERLHAAEEVCWAVYFLMDADMLDVPVSMRTLLGGPLKRWGELVPELELKHDTILHVLAGGFGIHAPGCPACEAEPDGP